MPKNGNAEKKKDGRGGRRQGAGRKPKESRALYEQVKQEILDLNSEMIEIELWDKIQEIDPDDNTKVITRYYPVTLKGMRTLLLLKRLFAQGMRGDVQAAREFLDRVLGKPKELIEYTDKKENNYSHLSANELINESIKLLIKSSRALPSGGDPPGKKDPGSESGSKD